uniref:C3H1-type domain-containing protein n=1 Tax=Mesocestoides corti TaxID=53468 RepID=A0A5K3FY93_MESCO
MIARGLVNTYKTLLNVHRIRGEFATWKGEACKFAHSILELRAPQNHPKYRTKPCVIYTITGACPFGVRCFFVHRNNPPSTMVFRDNASLNYSL